MSNSPTFSSLIENLKAASTVAFNTKANEMRQQGIDVVAMTAGEPDFQPPPHIKEAARDAIAKGLTKYTPPGGTLEVRQAVADKFARENQLSYDPKNQIVVSTGGKQVLHNAYSSVLNPGDEVIVPTPAWVTYEALIGLAQGKFVSVPTNAKDNFIPDPDAIEAAITPKTKVITINSPCNPTGAVYPKEVIKAIADLAEKHNLWLFTDELYEKLVYEGEFCSAGQFYPERTLIIHGASKEFALTGWRIGYGAGPAKLIKLMTRLQGQVTNGPNALAQHAVAAALNEHEKTAAFVAETKTAYQSRRDVLVKGLNDLELTTPMPKGAFYALANLSRISPDEHEAAMILLEQAHVGVVPGTDFHAPHHARFSYATSKENIEKALERIAKLLS